MTATIEEPRGECRTNVTNEERVVLALEAIASHLAKLASLWGEQNHDVEGAQGRSGRRGYGVPAEAATENERGDVRQDWPSELDITRTTLDQFTVGKYHYTDLKDAIAQAKRSHRQSID